MAHSTNNFYLNDNYPLTTDVFSADGETLVLPIDATIDIVNQITGATFVTNETCTVASGIATYYVLSGSSVSQTPGRYMGYMRVQIDNNVAQTIAIPFDVLDKGSYLVVERWRQKVEDSAPSELHIDNEHGRDWIDQAVAYLNSRYAFGYTSVLGSMSPAASASDMEFVAIVAALMARTAWWAGKGSWRDEEMSFDGTPFQREWEWLETRLQGKSDEGWFDETMGGTVYNRDNVFYQGIKYDSPDYWYRTSTEPDPETEIPI